MQRKHKLLLIITMFVFIIMIGLLISMYQIDSQTPSNTTEYIATVSKLKIVETGKDSYIDVYTDENKYYLYVLPHVCKHINIESLNINEGDKIIYRVENNKLKQLDKVEFVNIVSLQTEKKEIFSLSDYNTYTNIIAKPPRIVACILAVTCLLNIILIISKTNPLNNQERKMIQ